MSEFHVTVVRVGPVTKHPNADTLGVTHPTLNGQTFDYPCIVRLNELREGDLAVYIPIDSVIPNEPRWAFLDGHLRIKAKRLRGYYSQGLLVPASSSWLLGQEVSQELGITKYEPPEDRLAGGGDEHCPFAFPTYTDIEGLRRWPDILHTGEEVIITEKLHGACWRAVYREGRLWIGSHTNVKRPDDSNLFWKPTKKYDLEARLAHIPGTIIYGEVYGQVGGHKYAATQTDSTFIAAFDALDLAKGRYLDYDDFVAVCTKTDIPRVPALYRGPWQPGLQTLAEGRSTIPEATCVREGFVVKPVKERIDERIGRVILKRHGEGFLLRKGA